MVKNIISSQKKKQVNLEIERKFLLKRLPVEMLKKTKHEIIEISQYYLFINGVWQRFRIAQTKKGTKYIHTIKHSLKPGVFQEDEREMSKQEFVNIVYGPSKDVRIMEKTRYVVKFQKLKFEIDFYKNLSLVTLEVELPKIDHVYKTPAAISKEILMELTGMKQFSNFNLAIKRKK